MGGETIKTFGIDISVWQKGISLSSLANEGVQFVIVRAGQTASNKTLNKDSQFEYNYNNLKNNNMPLGCYYYSRAVNYDEGKKEALFLYNNCLIGKTFEYPVYMDVEDTSYQQSAGKENVTLAIKGFCETLENLGYYVGVYCNLNWANNYLDYSNLKNKYDFWLAAWNNERPDINKYKYGMWQFGGSINKLRSPIIASFVCDQDYAYKDYPKIMKEKNLNGFKNDDNNTTLPEDDSTINIPEDESKDDDSTIDIPGNESKDDELDDNNLPSDNNSGNNDIENNNKKIILKILKKIINFIINLFKKKN